MDKKKINISYTLNEEDFTGTLCNLLGGRNFDLNEFIKQICSRIRNYDSYEKKNIDLVLTTFKNLREKLFDLDLRLAEVESMFVEYQEKKKEEKVVGTSE